MTDPEALPPLFASPQPSLTTARLRLRLFTPDDAPRVQLLLADEAVAKQTLSIPHPYPDGAAAKFLATHAESWSTAKHAVWALARRDDDAVVGTMSLRITLAHRRAEVGYWIARAAWGQGFATEALVALVTWGFDVLGLHRIDAHHFTTNPASGKVMIKAGMRHEGRVRGAVWRDDVPRDLELYSILRTDPRPALP